MFVLSIVVYFKIVIFLISARSEVFLQDVNIRRQALVSYAP